MQSYNKKLGFDGEALAADYLTERGYRIEGRNLACKFGEVDIVARKSQCLYFVEIKTRTGNQYGSALESITPQKMSKLRQTAQVLLNQNKSWQSLIPFFSVVAIDETSNGDLNIEFLPDAFE